MTDNALLIFVKNLIAGHVKTRLAATLGNDAAIDIYKQLLINLHDKVGLLEVDKIVFYSNFIEGVTLYNLHSFPSGHTTSIFALAATLAFFLKNKNTITNKTPTPDRMSSQLFFFGIVSIYCLSILFKYLYCMLRNIGLFCYLLAMPLLQYHFRICRTKMFQHYNRICCRFVDDLHTFLRG